MQQIHNISCGEGKQIVKWRTNQNKANKINIHFHNAYPENSALGTYKAWHLKQMNSHVELSRH
jgi:hypothetical protein